MIDFSLYLKNDIDDYRSEERYDAAPASTVYRIHPLILNLIQSSCFHDNRNSQIASILDQKNYVEELNRQLK